MENLLIDLLLFAIVFGAGVVWGKKITVMRIAQNIADNPDNMANVLNKLKASRLEEDDEIELDILVERHEDQIYLYDSLDNEFLAQGSSLQEAIDRVGKRFPDRKYRGHLTREQADVLGIKI